MATLPCAPIECAAGPRWLTGRRRTPALLLVGLCAFLFLYGLGAGELYKTESLRAIVAAEFLRSGDWITPRLYGEPLLTKPPGAYAAIALASWPSGGVSEWTARLPSAAAATLVVFLVYGCFRRYFGQVYGLVAAAIAPASMMWLAAAPSAEIDMLQLAWVASAVLCFVRAVECHETGDRRAEWLWLPAALLCVAGGALTKWTAPAFFYLTAIPFLLWRHRLYLLWGRPHLLSVLVAILPCVAWVLAVAGRVGWAPLFDTVSREALQHLSPMHHTRPYPWAEVVEFPLLFLAANLPWSAAALVTLPPAFMRLWDERGRRLLQALHCWVWPNLLFWSLVPGHHVRHALPLQPGLAGLAAMVWIAWLSGRLRWPLPWVKPGHVLVGLLAAWLVVKIVFVQGVVPNRDGDRFPREKAEQIARLVPSGETLYLCDLKDEGILFYYGRPARRVDNLDALGRTGKPVYCVLTASEWEARPGAALLWLRDEQGDPFVLTQVLPQ